MRHDLKKLLVLFAAIFLLAIGVNFLVFYNCFYAAQERAAWVSHTEEVIKQGSALLSHLTDAETGQRGYLVTGNPKGISKNMLIGVTIWD